MKPSAELYTEVDGVRSDAALHEHILGTHTDKDAARRHVEKAVAMGHDRGVAEAVFGVSHAK